ncbi:MAG: nucleoside monophosphate kinase [Candidatus Yanofskybacteria bacterium]|nr:nucleoside monophosphate kinase [Candidatus Yanofskybacteria bacterium]
MEATLRPQAVFFVGAPGSGKDTQAGLLIEEFGFIQVPSSKLILAKFAANPDDPVIREEKRKFDTGELNSGPFVAEIMMEFVRPVAAQGKGLIFSGSPRTVFEAEIEVPEMVKVYGADSVLVINLVIPDEVASSRIATRRLCRAHNHPIPATPEFASLTTCPKDGSELYVRELDDPSKTGTRFSEYRKLTEPTLNTFRANGVPIFAIDASQSIQAIHQEVVGALERRTTPAPRQ